MPLVSIGGGPSISWGEFLDGVRGHVPTPIQTALLLADHGCRAFPLDGPCLHPSGIDVFSASAGVLGALAEASEPLPVGGLPDVVVGDQVAANALATYAARIVSARVMSCDGATRAGRDQLHGEFYADLSCQRSAQTNPMMEWVLANYVLGWSPGDRGFQAPPTLDLAARACYGADASSVATALALVVSHGVQHPHLDLKKSISNLTGDPTVGEALSTVVTHLACPVSEVRRVLSEDLRDVEALASRVVAFWHRHPLIHLGGPNYMTAPPRILPAALGLRRVFALLEAARTVEGIPDTAASRLIGRRFQDFLGLALAAAEDRVVVLPEHEFRVDHNALSPDFVLVDRGGKTVTLLEAKIRSLRASSYYGTVSGSLFEDLAERFAGSIVQVLKYLRAASEAETRGRLSGAGRRAWTEVVSAQRLVLLVVAPSLPAAIAGARLREELWASVERRLRDDPQLRQFWESFSRGREVMWHVADAEDVCVLAGWRTDRMLGGTLVEYIRATQEQPTFSIDGALHSVLDFVAGTFGEDGLALPAALDQMTRDFWDTTCRSAFGKAIEPTGPAAPCPS